MSAAFNVVPGHSGLSVSGDLLRIHSLSPGAKGTPLWMEFSVNMETGPFLVSSTRATMWITPRVPKVRAAFRRVNADDYFKEVVSAVADLGREAKWGNVQPFTPEGLLQAVAHLRSYDLNDLEVLAHPETDWGLLNPIRNEIDGDIIRTVLGFPVEDASWLDKDTVVVVPQNKDYVGFLIHYGDRGVSVVHNACRGIAICRR